MLARRDNDAAALFRERFLSLPPPAQAALAPFLPCAPLRRVVQTLFNDERGDYAAHATNPRVLAMLQEAKDAIDGGYMTEEEVSRLLVAYAKARACARADDASHACA